MSEAVHHPHNVARGTFVAHSGIVQPAPAPRFSRTPTTIQESISVDANTLREWQLPDALIEQVLPARAR